MTFKEFFTFDRGDLVAVAACMLGWYTALDYFPVVDNVPDVPWWLLVVLMMGFFVPLRLVLAFGWDLPVAIYKGMRTPPPKPPNGGDIKIQAGDAGGV